VRWNLRMVAAQRGVWKASDLRRVLAEAGLVLSAGKMSHLWSGRPISVRLDDLNVICAVLECTPSELLLPDPPARQAAPASGEPGPAAPASIRPSRTGRRRSAPPV
jgi:DNA-binding Xre family transcriptional regulator